MTCIKIPGGGFMCVADVRYLIHKGRRWHFENHSFCGLMFCNRDGDGIDFNHVPKEVIQKASDILVDEEKYGKYIGPCSDCKGPVFEGRDGNPWEENMTQEDYEEMRMCLDCQVNLYPDCQ